MLNRTLARTGPVAGRIGDIHLLRSPA